jgi:hypothetical protein
VFSIDSEKSIRGGGLISIELFQEFADLVAR